MSSNVAENLKSLGISVTHLKNQTNIEKHRFIDSSYNQQMFRYDSGDCNKVDECSLGEIRQHTDETFDVIVISDYDKGFVGKKTVDFVKMHFSGIPIFVDTKKKDISMYQGCYVKINEKEYHSLYEKPERCHFIVTLGSGGATYSGKVFPTRKVDVFDVVGAGDVFLSGLVYGFMKYHEMERAIGIANHLASISVTKQGTYVVNRSDL